MVRLNENFIKRFNDCVYELYLAENAFFKEDQAEVDRNLRSASESISQSIEQALQYFLYEKIPAILRNRLSGKSTIFDLVRWFVDEDGEYTEYYYDTYSDTIEPSVDFNFFFENKANLTNLAKHKGAAPDRGIIDLYVVETRKFLDQYLNCSERLKYKEDFENSNSANWDLLYSACDRFDSQERTLILVIGPNQNIDEHQMKSLALPSWDLIIDFDYESRTKGFYKSAYSTNEVQPHIYKMSDTIDNNSFSAFSQVHYHLFADNYLQSGIDKSSDFNDWNRKYSRKLGVFFKSFSEVCSAQKTIVLFLYDSRRHVDAICKEINANFGNQATLVLADNLKGELNVVAEDWSALRIEISLADISEGLNDYSSNFGKQRQDTGKFIVPHMDKSESDASGELTATEFAQYEEYFEVVHKDLPLEDTGDDDSQLNFLIGNNRLSWRGLQNNYDVQKKKFAKSYIQPLERIFDNSRGKLNLIHEAGFGGTTVARRIAWYFHNEYPTLILKNYREDKVKELLVNLHEKTRKSIFLILESPQVITLDEVESLYRSIPQTRPMVFLVVKRGKPKISTDLVVNDWGNDVIDLVNAYKPYLDRYTNPSTKLKKEQEFDKIIFSSDPIMKTPFYIGLLTFEADFFAIKDFIHNFCREVENRDEQRKTLLYLSLCHDYLGCGLPSSFFRKLFKIDTSEILYLEKYFAVDSSIPHSILFSENSGNHKFWYIKHNVFAKELIRQLLSGNSENPEIWKQNLANLCCDFIWDSVIDAGNSLEYIEEILQKLFIGNRVDRAGEDFTTLITDIPKDDRERVFKALKDAYPENPHYCSHLARFYAYHNKNRDLALKYANEAISLASAAGYEDSLLYHIKGMCLRADIYDKMSGYLDNNIDITESQRKEQSQLIVNQLIPECASQFELSRSISEKYGKVNEHGYIAHIQLLIRAIDYGVKISGKSKADFFKADPEPFMDWLDMAESLLEEIKRINVDNDESGKIEDCVNSILDFYENYDQILQNLRNQLMNNKNPTRARRQIVRTYMRGKDEYQNDLKVINNILSLMEDNIENEPDNERNFYLWFRAARYSNILLDEAVGKLSKWNANSKAIDATYYFYILKVIRALQGYSEATQDALDLIKECKSKGRSNTTIYEWLGKGRGLGQIVNRDSLDLESKHEELQLIDGFFTEYIHDGYGKITIAERLEVFFNPTQAKLTSADKNKPVQFYLGFSYDGLRADSLSVKIKK